MIARYMAEREHASILQLLHQSTWVFAQNGQQWIQKGRPWFLGQGDCSIAVCQRMKTVDISLEASERQREIKGLDFDKILRNR